MIAAQATHNGKDLVDIVGMGETEDEALQALWPYWLAMLQAEDPTVDARTASAWMDDAVNGDGDTDYTIRWVRFD